MSALDNLDDAVRRFAADGLERQGVVTGWVLLCATSTFTDDGEPSWSWDYSVGPDTDLIRAIGLVEASRLVMHGHLHSGTTEDGDL